MKQLAYGLVGLLLYGGAMGLSVTTDCPAGKYLSKGECLGKYRLNLIF